MKSIIAAFATVPLYCGLMLGQNMAFTGQLVAAGCQAGAQPNMQAKSQSQASRPGSADRMRPSDDASAKPTKGYDGNFPYYTSTEDTKVNRVAKAPATSSQPNPQAQSQASSAERMRPSDDASTKPTKGYEDGFPFYTSQEDVKNNPVAKGPVTGRTEASVESASSATQSASGVSPHYRNPDVNEATPSANVVEQQNINDFPGYNPESTTVQGPCRIQASTKAFALQLSDGRVIPFDSASNAKIYQQIRSGRVQYLGNPVEVHATMQRGTLSMQSMKM